MRPACVIVDHPFLHNAVEMPLVQRDHEVETVSSQGSKNAFTDGIRHGRPHGRFEHAQTHMTHPLIHVGGENGVTVMNQYAVRVIDWDRFPELLHGPLRSRMRGDIDMHQSAAGMLDDDKDIEHAKRRRDRYAEVTGHDASGLIAEKRGPALRLTAFAWASHAVIRPILAHGSRRHAQTKLE